LLKKNSNSFRERLSPGWREQIIPVSIIIAAAILYFPVLFQGFFCWDDQSVPLGPLVRNFRLSGIPQLFTVFHAGLYHPVTTLTFILDYKTGSGSPFPFHLTNLILHLANIYLVWILTFRLFRDKRISLVTTLLFALSPVQAEAIAWVSARKDLLVALFTFAALISYTSFTERNRNLYYILTLVFVVLACLSKIQAAVIPFLFVLIDYRYGRKVLCWPLVVRMIPVFVIVILTGLINLVAQNEYGYMSYNIPFSLAERFINFTSGFFGYIFHILLPVCISIFYPFPFQPGKEIPILNQISPLVFLIFLVIVFILYRKQERTFVFGLLFFLFSVFIVLIVNNYREFIMAGRYAYMGSAGLFMVIGIASSRLILRNSGLKPYVYVVIYAYLAICISVTAIQVRKWNDPLKLFESACSNYPDSPIILNTMGKLYIDRGKPEEAAGFLARAVIIDPSHAQAWYNKGIAEMKLNHPAVSMQDLSKAIMLNPSFTDAYFARGNLNRVKGDYKAAASDYTKVLSLDPVNTGAMNNRAIVKGAEGDFAGAILDLDNALAINPGLSSAWYLRGVAKFQLGINGCDDLQKALSLGYSDARRAVDYYCKAK
jgi:protein O-mannosyl-transferase